MSKFLILFLIPVIAFAQTVKKIDTIENNDSTDITLSPTGSVIIDTFAGQFVLQSGVNGEIEESAITTTELGYLSGATLNIQSELDLKSYDSQVVHLIDDESIQGVKTFIGQYVAVSTANGSRPCPVMTEAQRDAIASPAEGDCVVNSTENSLNFYLSSAWGKVGGSSTPTTTIGDLIVRGAIEDERLEVSSTSGHILTSNGTGFKPTYQAPPVSTTLDGKSQFQSHNGVTNTKFQCDNEGEFIVKDSSTATGWACSTSLQGKFSQVSDWKDYVPVTQSIGTPTITKTAWRRVGDSLEIDVQFISGVPTSVEFQYGLPDGLVIASNFGANRFLGNFERDQADTLSYSVLGTAGDTYLNGSFRYGSSGAIYTPKQGDAMMSNGNTIAFTVKVPIEGWTNGLDAVTENKTMCEVVAVNNDTDSITKETEDIPWKTIEKDNCGFWDNSGNTGANTNDAFTPDRDMLVSITGYGVTSASDNLVEVYEDGVNISIACSNRTSTNRKLIGCKVPVTASKVYTFRFSSNTNSLASTPQHRIHIVEMVSDDAVIAATLQGINDTPICQVIANGRVANGTITANTEDVTYINKIKDNCNVWKALGNTDLGTFDTFQPNKDSMVSVDFTYQTNGNSGNAFDVYEDAVKLQRCGASEGTSAKSMACKFIAKSGKNYTFRPTASLTAAATSVDIDNQITITELPDLSAVIANLSLESDRCQTKKLQSNHSTTGNITDLTFNNLEIGKKYTLNMHIVTTGGTYVYSRHDGLELAQAYSGSGYAISAKSRVFTATATTTEIYHGSATTVIGNDTYAQTWAELCYKGNTVTTTEFD